jgi:hypothetical protein
MTRAAITPQRFLRNFAYVRSAHDDWNTGSTDRIRHAVCFGDHAGHGSDADQSDPLVDNELDQFGIAHRSCVAIDKNNFMAGRGERLQQKHPQMRHEVLRDAIVGVIEKYFQFAGPQRQPDAGDSSLRQLSAGVGRTDWSPSTNGSVGVLLS